ncbi:MAG: outer membrane protein assembly factor BamE [Rickettsiales bacterium]|nr:outer membrane protein assembly factor BamE [Rickettsiales bacterium]
MTKPFAIAATIMLAACAREYKAGVPMREIQVEAVKSAKTKAEVTQILGSPAAVTFAGPEKWFYFNAEGSVFAFFDPDFKRYDILSIGFDEADDITEIRLKNLANRSFGISSETTEVQSEIRLNFFEELFGNIGRFSPGGLGQQR